MGDIVNLNKARKSRAKLVAEKQAADNRVKYGLSKAEKKKLADEKQRLDRHVDGHRRSRDDESL